MKARLAQIAAACAFWCLASAAWGHGLHVFATAQGKTVSGDVYYSDGKGAAGAALWWEAPGGERVGEAVADSEGKFSFDAAYRSDLLIVADSGDGHRAEYRISVAERPGPSPLSREDSDTDADSSGLAGIEAIVDRAVARHVTPLREQIDRLEHTIRLRDILGGVGFLFGAAGLMALYKARSSRERP